MVKWLMLSEERRTDILEKIRVQTKLKENAIEKDWWVTLALRACFSTPWSKQLVFKGGTSLSKSWNIIQRFSEDIDLVIDREVLGFKGELSNNQIKKLRTASSKFISIDFKDALQQALIDMNVDPALFTLTVQETNIQDKDPQILELAYKSVLEKDSYLREKVLIEIGARSLLEPASEQEIHSIIGTTVPDQSFSGIPFRVMTVNPQRTFLEKIFLLHEEFSKDADKIRTKRMSRHLYDLEKLMDTEYGKAALENHALYSFIIKHREKYTPIKGIDYSKHQPANISFVPPAEIMNLWEEDYKLMQSSMIHGESLEYTALHKRLEELQARVRSIKISDPSITHFSDSLQDHSTPPSQTDN